MNYRVSRKRIQGESIAKRFLRSPLFFFLCFGVMLIAAISFAKAFFAWRVITNEVSKVSQQTQIINQQEKELDQERAFAGDPAYQELQARKNLGLKKPGEEVIVIVPQEQKSEVSDQKSESNEEKGWWAMISKWFKK